MYDVGGFNHDLFDHVPFPLPDQSLQQRLAHFAHHKRVFGVGEQEALKIFEERVRSTSRGWLETSCKLHGDEVFGSRFVLWRFARNPQDESSAYWDEANEFLDLMRERAGFRINRDLVDQVIHRDFDFSTVSQVVIGMDLRTDEQLSRAKVWLIVRNAPETIEAVLDVYGRREVVRRHMNRNDLLFGFDFARSGQTRLKVYPDLWSDELAASAVGTSVRTSFSAEARALIDLCHWLHISVDKTHDGQREGRVLHLHPQPWNAQCLADAIGDERLDRVNSSYDALPVIDRCISLHEDEIANRNYRVINVDFFGGLFE